LYVIVTQTRSWILKRLYEDASVKLLSELAADDLDAYKNLLRLSEEKFEELLQKVSPFIQKKRIVIEGVSSNKT
ncbi:hypothetical protein NQ314_002626, partial [Rhamnusium bicolor]